MSQREEADQLRNHARGLRHFEALAHQLLKHVAFVLQEGENVKQKDQEQVPDGVVPVVPNVCVEACVPKEAEETCESACHVTAVDDVTICSHIGLPADGIGLIEEVMRTEPTATWLLTDNTRRYLRELIEEREEEM